MFEALGTRKKSLAEFLSKAPMGIYFERLPALYREMWRIQEALGIASFGEAFNRDTLPQELPEEVR